MSAPLTARQHALRIAALEALSEAVKAEYEKARAEAEPVFAAKYAEEGNDRQAVLLPSGEKVGQFTIKAPAPVVDMPADALLDWCRDHFPHAVEEYIDPAHLGSADVIAAVRDKLPDLIRQRVRPATAKALTEEIVKGKGLLADRHSGEAEKVATVTPGQPTGAFAFTDGKSGERRARIMAELLAGRLQGVIGFGPLALPAPEPEPEPDTTSHLRPPYGDEFGFLDPVRAAMHAKFVQGGYSTAPVEAYRMIRDGRTAEVRARAWLAGQGLDPDDPAEGRNTPWPPPDPEAGQ
jgi:hypothetical protein